MGSFLALVVIVLLSLLVVRLGSNALVLTGMSRSVARFQAASAFFGVGFTTSEAELVVKHPVRRRIILHLIIAGNIGLTSVMATLIVTIVVGAQDGISKTLLWLGITVLTLLVMALVLNLRIIRNPLDRLMRFSILKAGMNYVANYDDLLNLEDGFVVMDAKLKEDHDWVDQQLCEARPADSGVIVLGLYHENGEFTGAPNKHLQMKAGDVLTVYGKREDIQSVLGGGGEA